MFNIIICDDEINTLKKIAKIVDKYMKNNRIEYKRHLFNDYNESFMKIISTSLPFKIYILDIETPSRSGIDIAREIRRRDLDSVIIFLTGHEELGGVVLKNDLMFLSFINKFDNCEERLTKTLRKAFDVLHKKQVIKIQDGSDTYIINLNDILYFYKDSYERKTIIKTDYTEFKVHQSLTSISKQLDDRFQQTHRSCITNMSRVDRIDKNNRIIYFDNNTTTDLLSDKYKKELGV